jgi:uncharacterized membrane protein
VLFKTNIAISKRGSLLLQNNSEVGKGLSKQRLEALGDGIFAIAMTLLVLDVKLPEIAGSAVSPELLKHAILGLWPRFVSFFASFVILGVLWIAQTGYFHFVKRVDRWFLWINLLFLMFIVIIPFSTDLLGRYPLNRTAAIVYGCNGLMLEITLFVQWYYATSEHRLVGSDIEQELVHLGKARMIVGVCAYASAVLLAFINPAVSLIFFVMIPIMYILPSRVDMHWMHSHG